MACNRRYIDIHAELIKVVLSDETLSGYDTLYIPILDTGEEGTTLGPFGNVTLISLWGAKPTDWTSSKALFNFVRDLPPPPGVFEPVNKSAKKGEKQVLYYGFRVAGKPLSFVDSLARRRIGISFDTVRTSIDNFIKNNDKMEVDDEPFPKTPSAPKRRSKRSRAGEDLKNSIVEVTSRQSKSGGAPSILERDTNRYSAALIAMASPGLPRSELVKIAINSGVTEMQAEFGVTVAENMVKNSTSYTVECAALDALAVSTREAPTTTRSFPPMNVISEVARRHAIATYYVDVLDIEPPRLWKGDGTVTTIIKALGMPPGSRDVVFRVLEDVWECQKNGLEYSGERRAGSGGQNKLIELDSIEAQIVADGIEGGLGLTQTTYLVNKHRLKNSLVHVGRSATAP